MFPRRPGRIAGFSYIGLHRYSVTVCTYRRTLAFSDHAEVELVLTHIRRSASAFEFAIHAYCFMPDHLHLVTEGTAIHSDFQRFMSNWKQHTGYEHKRRTGDRLWQDSYFDHVLRDDEQTQTAIKYLLENPVRKRMVARFEDFPASGSDVYTVEQLQQFWQAGQG